MRPDGEVDCYPSVGLFLCSGRNFRSIVRKELFPIVLYQSLECEHCFCEAGKDLFVDYGLTDFRKSVDGRLFRELAWAGDRSLNI